MNRRHISATAVGAILTAVLFSFPQTYTYAPMVGGLVSALWGARTPIQGTKIGVLIGLYMFPLGIVLVLGFTVTPLATLDSGVSLLFESLRGMGDRNLLFYCILIYFIGLYTALAGGLFGALGGAVRGQVSGSEQSVMTES